MWKKNRISEKYKMAPKFQRQSRGYTDFAKKIGLKTHFSLKLSSVF
jgi:hypothetical protein